MQLTGMRAYFALWAGQIISQTGSAMTAFAVGVWLFEQTNSAATLTWAATAFFAPLVFLSPFAGTIVDRYDRKLVMGVTDGVAGVTTIIMFALLATGNLAIWQIYILNFINGAFNSMQWPAFSAATTMLMDKENYARAAGLTSIGETASNVLAPLIAAAVLAATNLQTVLLIDIVTFSAAIGSLFVIFVPKPPRSADNQSSTFLQETKYGFTYIFSRPPLIGLQSVFLVINFAAMFGFALAVPMILAETNNNEVVLGSVQSIGAFGGVVGGIVLSAWGGPRRKVYGVLGGMIANAILGTMLMGLGMSLPVWGAAAFLNSLTIVILNGSNQAIWQAKVAPDVQGRVFAVRRLFAQVVAPISTALAGPLADNIFEPAMQEGGRWADTFGWLVGTGAGAGMSLMFVLAGAVCLFAAGSALFVPIIRNAEELLPDHVAAAGPNVDH